MQLLKKVAIYFINKIVPNYLTARYSRKLQKTFYKRHSSLRKKPKIIYTLTPPPHLSNIGDQAQVVAIYHWFNDAYPGMPIIEVNKDECTSMIKPLKKLAQPKDLIFIHSGGNMGDRGMWSEIGRRNIIMNFPNNKIVSLPQTIFFSESVKGNSEKRNTERIYNNHKNLTIIGRDKESGLIAKKMFPNCKTFSIPDFVLYLNASDIIQKRNQNPKGTLLCLRNDNESILTDETRQTLIDTVGSPLEFFDTTIDKAIQINERKRYLEETIELFDKFELIITDRYHGLIFATLLKKPTIVVPTVDHKLTSAFEWFKELSYIKFIKISEFHEIEKIRTKLLSIKDKEDFDWKKSYFNKLAKQI